MGIHAVVLETDSLKVFYDLKKGVKEKTCFGSVVSDILNLSNYCSFFSFSHVCMGGNGAAHSLAKLSLKYEEMRVWLQKVPCEVLPSVMSYVSVSR